MCSSPVPQSRACWIAGIEFFPGGFQDRAVRQSVLALERFGHAAIDVPAPASHLAPFARQLDAALLKRARGIGYEFFRIKGVNVPQSAALRAHPLRVVEAEHLRAGRLETQIAMRAGVVGGKGDVGRMRRNRLRFRAAGFDRALTFGSRLNFVVSRDPDPRSLNPES